MKKLAIVGIFYDGYYDIWEDFLELFHLNWSDCPYDLYIVDNEKEIEFIKKYNVSVIHAGKDAEYSRKVQVALEKIKADYFLLLLEDFFIGEKLSEDALSGVFNTVLSQKIKYYRMSLPEFTPKKYKGKVMPIKTSMEYTISCQPSLWEKEFLQKCIGDENYNAWVFESIYTKSKVAHSESFLEGCWMDYRNVLCLYHGAVQGKILRKTKDHFIRKGYKFKNTRPILEKRQEIKYTIKMLVKHICPFFVQKIIKENIKTDSIIEKYSLQTQELINKMQL